jgi:hypothetical protein
MTKSKPTKVESSPTIFSGNPLKKDTKIVDYLFQEL